MATFFGEVLAVPSRAGVDDDDDDEEEAAAAAAALEREETPEDREIRRELEKKREVHVLWSSKLNASTGNFTDEQFPCSKFIMAIGHNAVAFLSSFVLNSGCWEAVGSVKLWNEWCRTSNTTSVLPTDTFCLFYKLISDPRVLLCQCNCHVAEDQQFQWLEKTKEYKEKVCCPLLEQPNIIKDLPAAVLSYCQVWQIPAVLYQCYTDVIKLDAVTIEAFKPVLSSKNLRNLVKDVSKSTEILKKLVATNEICNNIYT